MRNLAGRSDIIAFGVGDTSIRRSIVSELSELIPSICRDSNAAIVSTYRHADVGGYPRTFSHRSHRFG